MKTIKTYDAHLDTKNRITLRGVSYRNYNVRVFENGCIIMEPRILTTPESISANTLKDMDRAVENFNVKNVSAPIDLSDFDEVD